MNDCSRDLMFPFSGFFVVGGGGGECKFKPTNKYEKNPKTN